LYAFSISIPDRGKTDIIIHFWNSQFKHTW
jgi:hypothetical protein